jgi:hypothetical protein
MLFLFPSPRGDQQKRAPALRLVAPDRRITVGNRAMAWVFGVL